MAENFVVGIVIKAKDEATAVLRKFGRGLDKVLSAPRKAGETLADTFFTIKAAIISASTALGLFKVGSQLLNVSVTVESLQQRVRSATNTTEEYASAWKTIEELGHDSGIPLTLKEVADAFIRLENRGLDPSREAIISYGNTAAALSASIGQVIEAVADATTFQFERLPELGIVARTEGQKIQFAFRGITTELAKDAAAIQQYLLDIGNTQFAGQLSAQADTFAGIWVAIRKTYEQALALLSGAGLFDVVKSGLRDIQVLLEYVVQTGIAKKWGKELGDAALDAGTHIKNLADIFSVATGSILLGINAFTAGIKALAFGTSAFYAEMAGKTADFLDLFGADKYGPGNWADKLREVEGALRASQEAFKNAVIEDGKDIDRHFDSVRDVINGATSGFGDLIDKSKKWKQDQDVKKAADEAAESVKGFAQIVRGAGEELDDIDHKDITSTVNDDGIVEFSNVLTEVQDKVTALDGTEITITTNSDGVTEYSDGRAAGDFKKLDSAVSGAADSAKKFGDETEKTKKKKKEDIDITKLSTKEYIEYRKAKREVAAEESKAAAAATKAGDAIEEGGRRVADAGAVMAQMIEWVDGLRDGLRQLSPAAVEAFDVAISGGADGALAPADQLQQKIAALGDELLNIRQLQFEHAGNPFAQWFLDTAQAAAEVERAFFKEAQSAEALLNRLADVEAGSVGLVDQAQRALGGFQLLDEATLSNLESEINRVDAANESMIDSAERLRDQYLDELDPVGKAARDLARDRTKLEEEYQAAVAAGNIEAQKLLKEAMEFQRLAHSETLDQLEEEEQARRDAWHPEPPDVLKLTTQAQNPGAAPVNRGGLTTSHTTIVAPTEDFLERMARILEGWRPEPPDILLDGELITKRVEANMRRQGGMVAETSIAEASTALGHRV